MSDTMDAIDTEADDLDTEPEAEVTEEAPDAEEPEEAPETTEEDDEGQPLSPGKAKALREEAARYRTAAREYGEVFDTLHPDDKADLLALGKMLQGDPKEVAKHLSGIAARLGGGEAEAEPEAPVDKNQPLTEAQLEKILADREKAADEKRQAAEAQDRLRKDLADLGYNPAAEKGTDEALLVALVQSVALNETNYDLQKAHERVEAFRRGMVKAVAKRKADQATGSPTITRGQPGSPDKKPRPFLPGPGTKVNPEWEAYARGE